MTQTDRQPEVGKFIGFAVDGYDDDKRVAISTGTTREAAVGLACSRVLFMGVLDGSVCAVRQQDMDDDTFQKIGEHLDAWFAEKGFPRTQEEGH